MKKIRNMLLRSALLLAIACGAVMMMKGDAHAYLVMTDNNYINEIVGGRALGMAGAFTAISDDPSGMYYNPAGLVFASSNQISLSVNTYKGKEIKYDDVYGGKPYVQDISSLIPSMFGLVQSLGDFKIGVGIFTLNNEVLDQGDTIRYPRWNSAISQYERTYYSINYNLTGKTLQGSISFAGFINDSFSMGVTISGQYRRTEEIKTEITMTELRDAANALTGFVEIAMESAYFTREMWGLGVKWGFQVMPHNIVALGFSIGTGLVVSDYVEKQAYSTLENTGATANATLVQRYSGKPSQNGKFPVEMRLGLSVFPTKKLIIAAEFVSHIAPMELYYHTPVQLATFNGALGFEYYVINAIPLRWGVFTNFSNIPKHDKNKLNQETRVDMYGVSLGIGWESRISSISLCAFYQFGWGEAQIVGNQPVFQDVFAQSYMISLTGSAKY